MEKKKFRINIIDIIILVLIVCVAVFAVLKFSDGGINDATSLDKAIVRYYLEECPDYVIAATEVGDPVYDGSSEQNMGVVTAIETGEPTGYVELEDGTMAPVVREGHSSVLITTEVSGTWSDHGVVVGSTIYAPGHSLVIYAGEGKYYLKVHSVELIGG